MDFLISGTHINPLYLIVVGFVIGICGGFFGVGGSFLAARSVRRRRADELRRRTDLAHIVGKSIVAAKKHRVLGNVDIKLGLIMVIGTIFGVETGAQIIQQLKRHAMWTLSWPSRSLSSWWESPRSSAGKAGKQ